MKLRVNWIFVTFAVVAALATALAGARLAGLPPAYERPVQAYMPPSPDVAPLKARIEAKARVARDTAAGRLSLPEAVALFRGLDACGPPPTPSVRDAFTDARSEDEAYCRSVIAWAAHEAPPGRATDVTRRLEAELDALLGDRPIRISDPSGRPCAAPTGPAGAADGAAGE